MKQFLLCLIGRHDWFPSHEANWGLNHHTCIACGHVEYFDNGPWRPA